VGVFHIQKNTVLVLDGVRMRIRKKVQQGSGNKWQLEETVSGSIQQMDEEELFRLLCKGNLRIIGVGNHLEGKTTHLKLTDDEKEEISWRLPYVKAVLRLPATQSTFEATIDEVWKKFQSGEYPAKSHSGSSTKMRRRKKRTRPPGWVSVYRWRNRYVRAGHDAYALLNKDRDRSEDHHPDFEQAIDDALEEEYLTDEKQALQEAVDAAKTKCKEKNEENERLGLKLLDIPSRAEVQKRLKKMPAFDVYAARFGRDAARNKFRSVEGHTVTSEPLERAEIDHTPLDLFVVDEEHGLPLGRPYITACIDDFTRCILGMYVGFVPPSYQSVALCLKHAFLPKVTQAEDYPDIQNSWFAYGVMRTLTCDNAPEFHSEPLENGCNQLGINLEYAPRKTGWHKAKIERLFRTMNQQVAHGTKGTTFSNIFERGDYNPEKNAVVRLSTLQRGLQMWVRDIYHQKKHSALNMPPETMWKLHARTEDIRVPGDRNSLQIIMGRPYPRRLTHKGIEFAGLYYGSEAVHELRMQYGSVLDAEIRVNEADIGEIHVLYGGQIVVARALKFEYAEGLSLWLHEQIKKHSPKYDPDTWLAAKQRLKRLFRGEPGALAKSGKRGRGRVAEQLGPKEVSGPKPIPQLPAPVVTLEASDFNISSEMTEILDIPRYSVVRNGGSS
jgi:putative transposase